ncbi:hypothetical protein LY78DRAFT_658883 [Colletotrichum sublineola]|nr:hypothetical protein LY78DRAFT_658883 [Colletotrichum sublineola]
MRFPVLVLVILALSAGGDAQNSSLPSTRDAPASSSSALAPPPASASSQAAIPNNSESEPGTSKATPGPSATNALLSSAQVSV